MLLQDKVVVVAGVGPGLGRAIALASAREGADVVLAARTASRLDDVAKEVTALGRRGLAVPINLADASAAAHLAEAAGEAFGRVDALVYNALAMPPIKDLMAVDLDAVSDSFEVNALAALRLTRLFVEALAASRGSVVMVSSMVVRFSQRRMGPYKLAKAALLAMAQPGHRTRAPGHPGQLGGARPHLERLAEVVLRVSGSQARRRHPADLRRDRGRDRPGPAAGAGGGRRRGGLPGLSPGPRDHRAVPGRQLRRVPPLSAVGSHAVGTAADLQASARRITGLTDFGPDDYTDGLQVLLASYARDAGLTPLGAKATRALLRGALVARLLSEAGWRSHPDWAAVPVERPVFVTGLPLSGAAAAAMQALIRADGAGSGGQETRPAHRYTLADFGLTGAEVDERFAAIPGYEPSKR
jgi:NADP-dependent 3-hydroxy acid dehydrogenase YdfG